MVGCNFRGELDQSPTCAFHSIFSIRQPIARSRPLSLEFTNTFRSIVLFRVELSCCQSKGRMMEDWNHVFLVFFAVAM